MKDGSDTRALQVTSKHEDRKPGAAGRKKQDNAATGASAAGIRAISARFLTFWFRAPIKAFFRTRVDYMGYVRAINPRIQAQEAWSWHLTTPALLAHAVKQYGWGFIPNQVLPPLLANATVGALLYTSYLQTLGHLHEPSSRAERRVYPPPPLHTAFTAGFTAGGIQSLIAAPLDALQVRFQSAELLEGKYKNMWQYANMKSREIGLRGIFAGWSLSFVKDSFGYGAFFATFEFVKSQCFYSFVSSYYGQYAKLSISHQRQIAAAASGPREQNPVIKPHYMMEPGFILLAGIAASITQQVIQHPLTRLQEVHYHRLEYIDNHSHSHPGTHHRDTMRLYATAYRKSWKQCLALARRSGGLQRWLYADFVGAALRQVPSTSAGLIVFEIVRRKYALDGEGVKIEKDGYDILLP
ncbi:mitochondrial carrier [Polychaeton citri CBS 116435]|uniref:Mitochondrial carrier n=1 Tax=Polychaeton citri CBS 116435 TaxID=1314669 RepID=A0A9P4QCH4_9PEZI|nr:mitochondrial carrier [Polychaeton citri CBS 116435]